MKTTKLAHSAYLEVFSYPTEDREKVRQALKNITPLKPRKRTVTTKLEEKITVLTLQLENQSPIKKLAEKISPVFSREEQIRKRLREDGSLALELDKQKAFQEEIALGKGIKIEFKIAAFPKKKEKIRKNAEKLLLRR